MEWFPLGNGVCLSSEFWARQAQREVVKIKKFDFSYWASSTPWGHVLSLKTFCRNPVLSWAIRYSVFQKVKSTSSLEFMCDNPKLKLKMKSFLWSLSCTVPSNLSFSIAKILPCSTTLSAHCDKRKKLNLIMSATWSGWHAKVIILRGKCRFT